jgi:hypothetical protein
VSSLVSSGWNLVVPGWGWVLWTFIEHREGDLWLFHLPAQMRLSQLCGQWEQEDTKPERCQQTS